MAGTLAVLFEADQRDLIVLDEAIDKLRKTTFFLDEKLVQSVLDRKAQGNVRDSDSN